MAELSRTRDGGAADVRPGAMTRAMRAVDGGPRTGPRALRWALVRDGRIVSEAIVPPDRALSVGAGGDVPCAGVRERPIAWCEAGAWRMRLRPEWSGRVGERALAALVDGGRREDDGWIVIELEDGARGRVVIGEHALLVQLVDPPRARTRPALPAALAGGFLRQADWVFTGFVAASFILHFAFVVGLIEADWPVESALIPSRHADVIFMEPTPPPEDVPEDRMIADATDAPSDTPSDTTDVTSTTDSPRTPRTTGRTRGADGPADPDQAAREALRASLLTIGGIGGNDGAMGDLLRHGATTANQDELIAMATGTTVAQNEGVIGERQGAGCPGCDRVGSIRSLSGGRGGLGPVEEGRPVEEVRILIRPEAPDFDDPPPPGFDTRELIRALRARMPAVQRCYDHLISHSDPDAEGRLTIAITVMPVGTVANLRADENGTGSDALAACTIRSLRETRVRVGPSEPLEFRYPIVFRRPG